MEVVRSEKMPVARGLAILMISVMIFVRCDAVMEVGINNEPAYTDARSIIEDLRIEQAKTRQVGCDLVKFLFIETTAKLFQRLCYYQWRVYAKWRPW